MRVVDYEITSDGGEDEEVNVTIIVETNRGTPASEMWVRDRSFDVMSGSDEAKGTIRLRPDQRIVISGQVASTTVLDRNQFASVNPKVQRVEDALVADEPSREIPHPSNNERIAQEEARLNKAAEVNKTDRVSYAEPEPTTQVVENRRTVTEPVSRVETKKQEVRTAAAGVVVSGKPNPDANKPKGPVVP